jgi:hypothetical protein
MKNRWLGSRLLVHFPVLLLLYRRMIIQENDQRHKSHACTGLREETKLISNISGRSHS